MGFFLTKSMSLHHDYTTAMHGAYYRDCMYGVSFIYHSPIYYAWIFMEYS